MAENTEIIRQRLFKTENYLGPFNPDRQGGYDALDQCSLFGCVWQSKNDNNTTAPAVWDGGEIITPNTTDWEQVSGDYEAWLLNKDKPATTGTTGDYPYNGMGRIRLQKNLVEVEEGGETVTKNLLTQAMFEDGDGNPLTNTVYVIQYDFVLGEDITVPANCVLEFDGGSISGQHTLTGSYTGISASLVKIFNTDVIIAGSWNVAEAYPEWFGAKGDGTTDDTLAVKKTCASFVTINVLNKYKCSSSIVITKDYTTVKGRGTIYFTSSFEIIGINCDNLIFKDFKIESLSGYSGVGVWCGSDSFLSDINPNTKIHYKNILIDHVEVDNFSSGYKELEFGNHGIFVRTASGASISDIIIQNCISRGSGCDPNVLNTCNGSDNIYIGSYLTQAAPMENVRILNNYCEYAGRQNLSFASDDPSCITNVVVSGNTFKDSEMAGLDIEMASNISIIGNTFINSGKYKGYYDQANSVKNDNFALQSGIAGATNTTSIISCKFYNCKNVVSSVGDALLNDCYIYNTPITLLDAAQLLVSCEDCTIINTEESAAVIYVYSVGYLHKFKNCTIDLAKDSYIHIIGNSLFDNCQIGRASSTASNTLLRCTGSFKNKLIGCSISAPGSSIISTGSSTSVHIEQCEITGEGIEWSNASGDIYINNSNLNIAYICGAYNITVGSFRINNCGISLKYKILIPLTRSIQISDNAINFTEFNDAANTGVDNLIFFWSSLENTRVRIENNRISGIADSVTLFVKERNAGIGYGAIYNIFGNMLFGTNSNTIAQQSGRKSATAASLIERNSLNGVDLTQ